MNQENLQLSHQNHKTQTFSASSTTRCPLIPLGTASIVTHTVALLHVVATTPAVRAALSIATLVAWQFLFWWYRGRGVGV